LSPGCRSCCHCCCCCCHCCCRCLQVGVSSIPPAVVSMLAVPLLLSAVGSSTADRVVGWFDACVAPWTTDLLGLFYVPAVAILPVLLRGMQGECRVVFVAGLLLICYSVWVRRVVLCVRRSCVCGLFGRGR
jgi:hypothetical protein